MPAARPENRMPAYPPPPHAENAEGRPRRVGVEIEFGDLSVPRAVALARNVFGEGAALDAKDEHRQSLSIPGFGTLRLELDMARRHREAFAHKADDDDPVRKITGDIVNWLTPVELVAPPLPPERLVELHPLLDALRQAGATGAGAGAQTAYGMHFNVEIASDRVEDLFRPVCAFALLEDWIRAQLEIALNRRLTGFVKPYPREWVDRVADPAYAPSREAFLRDYLALNPTRNRALDLTPLIDMLEPELAQAALGEEKRSPRPTFHYRLPDARLDEPDWSMRPDWMLWRLVEQAAADPDLLLALRLGWVEYRDSLIATPAVWVARCTDMLRAAGLIDPSGAPRE